MTVKEKKANAKRMAKAVKKMSSKVKKSLERKQVEKAVSALQKHAEQVKGENLKKKLLENEDDNVLLTFTLNQIPQKPTARPLQIKLAHPLPHSRACLIVKDPAKAFKASLVGLKLPRLAKVIGFSKLKKQYKQFKDKR